MNIKETALKVWDSNMIECPPENLTKFAEALVAELAKEYEWQPIETNGATNELEKH